MAEALPPGPAGRLAGRLAVAWELVGFLARRRAVWLLPLAVLLLVAAGLFFLAAQPAVSPFIYTLF